MYVCIYIYIYIYIYTCQKTFLALALRAFVRCTVCSHSEGRRWKACAAEQTVLMKGKLATCREHRYAAKPRPHRCNHVQTIDTAKECKVKYRWLHISERQPAHVQDTPLPFHAYRIPPFAECHGAWRDKFGAASKDLKWFCGMRDTASVCPCDSTGYKPVLCGTEEALAQGQGAPLECAHNLSTASYRVHTNDEVRCSRSNIVER